MTLRVCMFWTLKFNNADGRLVFACGRSLHWAAHRIPLYPLKSSETFSMMETVWKIPETALRRSTKLCKIAGRKDPTSDLNLMKSASRLVQYLSNALPRWGLFSTAFEAKEELRELILSLVRTYCTLGPSKEKMKFIKRGYSLKGIYPLFWRGERKLSFAGRIWRDDLYCVLFKKLPYLQWPWRIQIFN